ncbi:hypothetical protein WA026_017264 [Henosepilachna vigintioctopunctata]|uniref:Uncharacterized protein n=1 Tax=Henosepilachna vigintioctopunctata TaxID=420089 RepID=A0AAW1UKH8_9CUCU
MREMIKSSWSGSGIFLEQKYHKKQHKVALINIDYAIRLQISTRVNVAERIFQRNHQQDSALKVEGRKMRENTENIIPWSFTVNDNAFSLSITEGKRVSLIHEFSNQIFQFLD